MKIVNILFLVFSLTYPYAVKSYTCPESTNNWNTCTQTGVDWSGDDLLNGLRFSKEACAEWCESMCSRCVGWVYKDKGTWCHLKYIQRSTLEIKRIIINTLKTNLVKDFKFYSICNAEYNDKNLMILLCFI